MNIIVREAKPEDLPEIHSLVTEVFDKEVAPLYCKEGIRTFRGYIDLKHMEDRMKRTYWALVAENEKGVLMGSIFLKNRDHINLFFVKNEFSRKGVGRKLLEKALKMIMEDSPDVKKITVNSSPNAVEAYKRLGFKDTDYERSLHGIRFIPMERVIISRENP